MKKPIALLLILVVPLLLFAQVDFDQYVPLRSSGQVPADFSLTTARKIDQAAQDDLDQLSARKRKLFTEQVNYSIDELLQSGLVTFGDPVSNYLQELGNRLTKNDPKLSGKLRFYAFNTNEANAFSTDQGIVFVTTGLIAQLTNEAQLAFVLCHEIIHYKEKHVLDLFDYTMNSTDLSYGEKMRFFSKYSRDNEFEADLDAVPMYHAAGYPPEAILTTFDVLIYSYLPFEEVLFDKEYFNNQWMYVPDLVFEKEKKEISARIDYNDRLLSHPNILKRKEALDKRIAEFQDWGVLFNTDQARFLEIRDVCRFEYVLNEVYSSNQIDALYGIYVLEAKYPNSRFLRTCKSQLWLDMMEPEPKQRNSEDLYTFYGNDRKYTSDYEGQISIVARTIMTLPKQAKLALGLRTIRDNYLRDTSDRFAHRLWEKAIEFSAYSRDFEIDQFSKMTFSEAVGHFKEEKRVQDSLKQAKQRIDPNWNKYEAIRNQKTGFSLDLGVDSTKFYLYGIADLLKDSLFKARFDFYSKKYKEKEAEEDELFEMTDEEQDAFYSEKEQVKLHLGMDTILLVHPLVYEIEGYESIDFRKTDQLEQRLNDALRKAALEKGIVLKQLNRLESQGFTAQEFNDLAQLMRSLEKRARNEQNKTFVLDVEELQRLRNTYGTSKVLLLQLQHQFNPQIGLGGAILGTVFFPIGMIYLPAAILSGHRTAWDVYVLDLNKGELILDESYYSNDMVSRKFIELRLDALFNQLKQPGNEE
jgi:hypothetical protein